MAQEVTTEFPGLEWQPTEGWDSSQRDGTDRWQLQWNGLLVGRVVNVAAVSRETGWKGGYWGKFLSPLGTPDKVFRTLKAAAEYVNNAAKRDFLREEERRVSK